MSPRLIAALLAVGLLAPAAQAAPASTAGSPGAPVLDLPLDWFTHQVDPADDLWQVGKSGATTYSYLRSWRPPSRLHVILAKTGPLLGPPPPPSLADAEKTYAVVERVGRDRLRRPLPAAAFLLVSAVCGIGGLAWWRRSSRDPA